ncbi:MAG: UDP-N-acetylglucosamine 2-epimerase [Legionella sp.]|nr:UDP-N-acetylglucosamine 2-epimerase [Legionella sp.]
MITRKIIYVTGTRADYGLMREVLKKLHDCKHIDFSVCVTGTHLSPIYGNTIREIEADAFRICGVIPVDVEQTTHVTMIQAIGHEILGMTEIFSREKPDIVLLLGDRGEMLAAALTAVHLNIPIVHLHGGERSGTVDEMVRHAISKLSHYHFVATEASKERLIKMGEYEHSIFVVGAPGLDEMKHYKASSRDSFLRHYNFLPDKKICLCVFHPVVQEYNDLAQQFHDMIDAALLANLQIICLQPNSDAGGQIIRNAMAQYLDHPDIRIITHLPRAEYINCMANVDVMLGNSSSGIIEAATFNLVVVNIGSRQNLREYGDNTIHVSSSLESISQGLQSALSREAKSYTNVYGDGNSSERCFNLLTSLDLDAAILSKCNAY